MGLERRKVPMLELTTSSQAHLAAGQVSFVGACIERYAMQPMAAGVEGGAGR